MTVDSKIKQTLSNLKGIKSTLRIYSAQTQDEEAKPVYDEALEAVEETIIDLENRMKTLEFEEPQYKGY
ncbi:DUF1657 domain-containing protein [Thermohalobacter berrensis]|uniref:DUF1657 domain-containing protein n=1 Tax=Thermohalobacter berrensis TaxID=99594 RepID=A0A419SUW2_9FIRM|nr:DUF1657 domain-containing protein [Thermohalobacter berrensis]RKD29010.1 hypothetical protein BET03_06595 [Thermohalobacter berrensis]